MEIKIYCTDDHKSSPISDANGMIFSISAFLAEGGRKAVLLNKFYNTLFPIILQYLWNTDEKYQNDVSHIIRTRYFGNKDIGLQTTEEMVQVRCAKMSCYLIILELNEIILIIESNLLIGCVYL